MAEISEKKYKDIINSLYSLYPLGILCQSFSITSLFGLLLLVFAFSLNLYYKSKAEKDSNEFAFSHLRWQIRTFYISTGLLFPLAFAASVVLILQFTDILAIGASVASADTATVDKTISDFLTREAAKITMILISVFIPVVAWLGKRYWQGYKLLGEGKNIEKVKTWLWL